MSGIVRQKMGRSNVGLFIDTTGRIVAKQLKAVPMASGRTVFVRCGYLFFATVVVLTLADWVGAIRHRKRQMTAQ